MFAYQMKKTLGCHQTWLENPRRNGGNWENHRWTLAMFQPEAYRPTIWTSAVLFPDQGPMGYVDPWRSKSGDPSAVAAFHVKKGRSERPFPARSRRGVGLGGPWWQNSEARKVECHRVDLLDGQSFYLIYLYLFIHLFVYWFTFTCIYIFTYIYIYIAPAYSHSPLVSHLHMSAFRWTFGPWPVAMTRTVSSKAKKLVALYQTSSVIESLLAVTSS